MDPQKRNQIITNFIFGFLVVVPLVIGVSVYSRPEPPPPPPKPYVYPTPPPLQQRAYVYGYAYDSSTNQPITSVYFSSSQSGQPDATAGLFYLNQLGSFTIPVATSTQTLTLTVPGYRPKDVFIGMGMPGETSIQSIGTVLFDPAELKWNNYTDSHLKFTISYPSSLYLNPGFVNTPSGTSTDLVAINFTQTPGQYSASIIQVDNSPDIYNHNTLDDYAQSYNTNDTTEKSRTRLSIGGKPAVQIVSKNGYVTTLMMRSSDHMIFNWMLWDSGAKNRKIYDQMLEKFQY